MYILHVSAQSKTLPFGEKDSLSFSKSLHLPAPSIASFVDHLFFLTQKLNTCSSLQLNEPINVEQVLLYLYKIYSL